MAALAVAPAREHRVSNLELFFDLVFVFALTQVTGYLAVHPGWLGLAEGMVLLALIWWSWVAYTWLGTSVRLDEGLVQVLLFAAMGAVFVVAIGLPETFADLPGGFDGTLAAPTIVVAAYAIVRLLHVALFAVASRGDPGLARAVARFFGPVALAIGLLLVGSLLPPGPRLALFALAVLVDYGGAVLGGGQGWHVAVGHFTERYGLIVIIGLGESIVSIGVGVADMPLSLPIGVVANLGLGLAACLWWLYFGSSSRYAEHSLQAMSGTRQVRAARDGYSFGHLLLVAGIVLVALGLKKVSLQVAEEGALLGHHAKPAAVLALTVGVAVYLLGMALFQRRVTGTWSMRRLAAAVAVLVLIPVGQAVAGALLLGLVVAAMIALILVERQHPGIEVAQPEQRPVTHGGS